MKKVILVVLAVGLTVGAALQPLHALDKKVDFSLNLGAMTDAGSCGTFSDVLFTFSPQLDVRIARNFMISAEAMVITDDGFHFDPFLLYPGILLSYTTGRVSFGGGAVLPMAFWDGGVETGDLIPKIAVDYRAGHIKLTTYILVDTQPLFSCNLIGLTVGYVF
jgi:hypothetical protein